MEGSEISGIDAGASVEITAIPKRGKVFRSWTINGKTIESKEEYVRVQVSVQQSETISYSASGRAKGRGNATWGYDKKPYKIKFDEKISLMNFTANKDWVLLAEYCDKSLMRTAHMCGLAQTAGLPYPIHYRHDRLYPRTSPHPATG